MSSRRLSVALVLVALGLLAWWLLRPTDQGPQHGTARPDAGTVARAPVAPLPPIAQVEKPPVDAAVPVPDGALTPEKLYPSGVLGRPVDVSTQFVLLHHDWWKQVPGADPPAFEGKLKERLQFVVEGGRVVGAHVTFPKGAGGSEVAGLSVTLSGEHSALPAGGELMRTDPSDPVDREGQTTTPDGRTFYWKAHLATKGEPPWGPETFDIRIKPF